MFENHTRVDAAQQGEVKYRPVPVRAGYLVGDDGSAWSNHKEGKWRQLHPSLNQDGYLVVNFWLAGRTRVFRLHRIILEAFIGPCPPGMMGLHKDDNKLNNRVHNLYWGTRKDNAADSSRNGRHARGTKKSHAKLNDESAATILRRVVAGESSSALATEFNVSPAVVRRLAYGDSWAHVCPETPRLRTLRKWADGGPDDVRRLRAEGLSIRGIVRVTGRSRNTVRQILRERAFPVDPGAAPGHANA